MPDLLPLAYSPAVAPALLREMERAGRALGLPLGALESLGQSEVVCRAFVKAWRRGDGSRMRFLAGVAREAHQPAPVPLAVA